MEPLGNKIKKIRLEKDLKQSALHPNQSAIAQIEGGKNKKPSPTTIQTIAQNLGITMEELVKDTDWKSPELMVEEGKYGYSELDFDLKILEDGKIEIQFKKYPRYDASGLENIYCPNSSSKLLFECKECKKPIISSVQIFCMGCGKKIMQSAGFESMDEYFKINGIDNNKMEYREAELTNVWDEELQMLEIQHTEFSNSEDNKDWYFKEIIKNQNKLGQVIRFLQIDSSRVYSDIYCNTEEFEGSILKNLSWRPNNLLYNTFRGDGFHKSLKDKFHKIKDKFHKIKFHPDKDWKNYTFDNFDDYCKGLKAKDEKIYNFHIKMHFKEKLYQKMADELKKYLNKIDVSSLSNDEEE